MELVIMPAEIDDIHSIGYLAYQVWPTAYKDILSLDQLQYMLELIYNPVALRKQMTVDHHQFIVAELEDEPVGFASYSKIFDSGISKLFKLYVRPDVQGKNLGKSLLKYTEDAVKELGATTLSLNVNRNNKAVQFYEKMGFKIVKQEDIDIGNNYFMNDFILEKKL